jgi:hypothetical protein
MVDVIEIIQIVGQLSAEDRRYVLSQTSDQERVAQAAPAFGYEWAVA